MATVNGTWKLKNKAAFALGLIHFKSISGPTVEGATFFPGQVITVTTAADGTFSLDLAGGDYRVSGGDSTVTISVPADSSTNRFEDLVSQELIYTRPALPWFAPNLDQQLLAWAADGGRFIEFVPTYANGLLSTATVKWPDGTAGVFTVDFINPLYESVDEYHVTYLGETTKTVTQPRITRNSDGQATNIPLMTVS